MKSESGFSFAIASQPLYHVRVLWTVLCDLVIWTQPSGPLCLWQCFNLGRDGSDDNEHKSGQVWGPVLPLGVRGGVCQGKITSSSPEIPSPYIDWVNQSSNNHICNFLDTFINTPSTRWRDTLAQSTLWCSRRTVKVMPVEERMVM